MSDLISYPQLSNNLRGFCEASTDQMVCSAPQWISGFFEIDQKLPTEYGWLFSSDDAIRSQLSGVHGSSDANRAYWTDQSKNVEAYSLMGMWRCSELLKPAIRSLNVGELITPGVLARSALELSAYSLMNANTIEKLLNEIEFPPNTIITSKEFEERVVKMIWGTRLSNPEPHLLQTNVLTVIQKLSKNPAATDLLPHYEFLCEIAHPNVVGNSRYWSHISDVDKNGRELRSLRRMANGENADLIREKIIWSLAWASGSQRNAFTMIRNGLRGFLQKLADA